MKSSTKTLTITAIVLIIIGASVFALRASTAPIEYGNDFARDQAAQNILSDRAKTITQLEDIVKQNINDPNKQESVKTAMRLLGKLRADEAAPLLAAHLSFVNIKEFNKGGFLQSPTLAQLYPAAGALIELGVPGVDALLYQASMTDDQKDAKSLFLTDQVLVQVLGKQPALTFVNDVISEQRDPKAKERLTIILTSLKKYKGGPRMNPYL